MNKLFAIFALFALLSVSFADTYYNYWNENNVSVWTQANGSVYVYYNGSTDNSSATSVMCDYAGYKNSATNFVSSNRNCSGNLAYGVYLQANDSTANVMFGVQNTTAADAMNNGPDSIGIYFRFNQVSSYLKSWNGASQSFQNPNLALGNLTKYKFEVIANSTTIRLFDQAGNLNTTVTAAHSSTSMGVALYNISGGLAEQYYSYIRKYTDTQPTIAYGGVENGTYVLNGDTYHNRRLVNISSSVANYQVALNYTYFNNSKMTIVNITPAITGSITLTYPQNNTALQNTSATLAWLPQNFSSNPTCNVTENNVLIFSATCTNNSACSTTNTTNNGNYLWNVTCSDGAVVTSATNNFTMDTNNITINTSAVLVGGTQTNAFNATFAKDGVNWSIAEVGGVPGYMIMMNFSNIFINVFNISIYGNYAGSSAHNVSLFLKNYTSGNFDYIGQLPNSTVARWYNFTNISSDYVQNALMQANITHLSSGNGAHSINLDYVVLQQSAPIPPNLTFISQIPIDINVLNVQPTGVNITYSVVDPNINTSSIRLFYRTTAIGYQVPVYVNGSLTNISAWRNKTYNSSADINYSFILDNFDFVPGTFNWNGSYMSTTAHTVNISLNQASSYLKMELLNVSVSEPVNLLWVMAQKYPPSPPAGGGMHVFYCNSSYTTGDPGGSPNCAEIYVIPNNATYDHCHSGNISCHMAVPFFINTTTGKINGVAATARSFFLFEGGNKWNLYGIPDTVRIGAMQLSADTGSTWANQTGTLDMSLHQFSFTDNETLEYYASATNMANLSNVSSTRADLLNISNIPPAPPVIIYPVPNTAVRDRININYTAATPFNTTISYYMLTLNSNVDGSFVQNIAANNSLNLNYSWNTTAAADGVYRIRVYAFDANGLSSYESAINITIDNTAPSISVASPVNTTYNTTIISLNFTVTDNGTGVNASTCVYSLDGGAKILVVSCANTTLSSLGQGVHSIVIYANDTVGNMGASGTIGFFIDSIPPVITFQIPSNGSSFSAIPISLMFTATDINGSGVTSCKYSLNGAGNISLPGCGNTTLSTIVSGTNNLTIYATDNAMFTSAATSTFIYLNAGFCGGGACPAIIISAPPFNSITNLTPTLSYTVYTNFSANATCVLSVDGFTKENTSVPNATLHNYAYSTLGNGNRSMSVFCVDGPQSDTAFSSFYVNFTPAANPPFENQFTQVISDFWLTWISFILAIIVFALAYLTGKTLSQISLTSAVGLFVAYLLTTVILGVGLVIYIYGAIVLLILGFVFKYVGM